ncbi:Nif11-like leader peptide family natural product precursor [Pseudanabaena sp. FACHB-2040]|uniref:Nif11-like leader peptide family natural product precursor n=1 Tax=Pseudanabaena sp. FACHB-2040 TaxID=2692859 RepID=UPI001687468D|nr:Nif11-like leader peptide family natural product precursor [Pseudanabaena sp. FACHB-2040]MBD0266908.1 Nif11-like leader peptide family natural product precursor [Cyanobacteria bacterium Co-bin8]MBD2256710.1 hypothetical protein [Pseudanabaena sp. FACHB-2040]
MATTTVLQFMQKTADDTAIREQLEQLLGVGDGDISTEAALDPQETEALKGERAPVVAEFAAQHGYPFSVEELITVVDAFQKHQTGQLSDEEFGRVLGVSTERAVKQEGGLRRLTRYLSRTYLGLG